MTRADIRERIRRQPFVPFRVDLTTGGGYDIYHPELIMVGLAYAVIGLTNDPAESYFERTAWVDLWHIVQLIDLPRPQPLTPEAIEANGQ